MHEGTFSLDAAQFQSRVAVFILLRSLFPKDDFTQHINLLPGQRAKLQFCCCMFDPEQLSPCGAVGINSHCLVLYCVPTPHV